MSGGSLSGSDVSTESHDVLLTGAVALASTEGGKMGETVAVGHHFTLYDNAEESWLKWSPRDLSPTSNPRMEAMRPGNNDNVFYLKPRSYVSE